METLAAALLLPMLCLLAMVLVPSRVANRQAGLCRSTACGGTRTEVVVKAVCGAALGSAVMSVK